MIDRLNRSAAAAAYRRFRWSTTARALTAVTLVLIGYVFLHASFARFDAAIAVHTLRWLGFHVHPAGPAQIVVSSGTRFDVTAIVTGSCSSAAGVLGLGAVTVALLPGNVVRRSIGGVLAGALFVVCNQLRILSILLVGWWLATASKGSVLATLGAIAIATAPVVVMPHRRLILRVACFLVGGLCGVLAYDVTSGGDYLHGMISYHALAGPMLTFGTLAFGILLLWRAVVGAEGDDADALPG